MDDSKRSFPFGAISAYFQVRNVSSWRVTTCTLDGQNPKQPHGMYKTLLKMGYTTISTVNFRECSSCLIAVSISNLDSPPLVVSDLKISELDRSLRSLRGRVPWNAVETPEPSVTWCRDANPGVWACGRFEGWIFRGQKPSMDLGDLNQFFNLLPSWIWCVNNVSHFKWNVFDICWFIWNH